MDHALSGTGSLDWNRLAPLPQVAPWNKGRRSRNWEHVRDRCRSLVKVPLTVTADLVTPVIHAEHDRTHLDAVLSFAALTVHPVASDYDQAAVIPLPLDLAWVSAAGQPLWCCTPLTPAAPSLAAREYLHKRYPAHRAEFGQRLNAVTTAGRWKEYRLPLNARGVTRIQARCLGHAEELRRLLEVVTHIGKKGSLGYGRVARWTVEEAAHDPADILAARAVPIDYYAGRSPVGILVPLQGWTPPYWYAPWWRPCMVPPTE